VVLASGLGYLAQVPDGSAGLAIEGVADVDGDGRAEVFVRRRDSGRFLVAQLVGCEFQFVENADGRPYEFVVGTQASGVYDGIGCVDVDGRSELVGLHGDTHGTVVEWTRTTVSLRDGQARNGVVDSGTFTIGRDDTAIDLLGQATCGDVQLNAGFDPLS
jgi:hypothetical protein